MLPAQSCGVASTELRRCRHRVAALPDRAATFPDRVATLPAQSCGIASTELWRCRHRAQRTLGHVKPRLKIIL